MNCCLADLSLVDSNGLNIIILTDGNVPVYNMFEIEKDLPYLK